MLPNKTKPRPPSTFGQLSTGSLLPLAVYDGNLPSHTPPEMSLSHNESSLKVSRKSSYDPGFPPATKTTSPKHYHWCTICEDPVPIKTCDGWKRHEKEQHGSSYICMPHGPIELDSSSGVSQCAFCGHYNPDDNHLASHNIQQCAQKSTANRFNRRRQLLNHLNNHGVFDAAATVLADRWHVTVKKVYYSCGFCVSIFSSNVERLNHIDMNHFRHSQTMRDWSLNTVIRGLLLQPAVQAQWQDMSGWEVRTTDLTWDPTIIANLQVRLETSEESAYELVVAAISSLTWQWNSWISSNSANYESNLTLPFQHTYRNETHYDLVQSDVIPSSASSSTLASSMQTSTYLKEEPAWNDSGMHGMDMDPPDVHPPQVWTRLSKQEIADNDAFHDRITPSSAVADQSQQMQDPVFGLIEPSAYYHHNDRPYGHFPNDNLGYLPGSFSTSFTDTVGPSAAYAKLDAAPNNLDLSRLTTDSTKQLCPAHRKSPSLVTQMKRRLSRGRLREQPVTADDPMDFDPDFVMRRMRDHDGSRSVKPRER